MLFYIPSLNEWQFAASGGNLSQGYIYAGSNTPGDVAWYAGNSGNSVHEVKQLSPNELGFYDMSGNVAEWTSSGSNGTNYVCGGDYSCVESSVRVTTATGNGFTSYERGLRLALKCE